MNRRLAEGARGARDVALEIQRKADEAPGDTVAFTVEEAEAISALFVSLSKFIQESDTAELNAFLRRGEFAGYWPFDLPETKPPADPCRAYALAALGMGWLLGGFIAVLAINLAEALL